MTDQNKSETAAATIAKDCADKIVVHTRLWMQNITDLDPEEAIAELVNLAVQTALKRGRDESYARGIVIGSQLTADAWAEGANKEREAILALEGELTTRLDSGMSRLPSREQLVAAIRARTTPPAPVQLPAMDLLAKFAEGTGGRRTGDLMRRKWLRVEVTEAGHAALRDSKKK